MSKNPTDLTNNLNLDKKVYMLSDRFLQLTSISKRNLIHFGPMELNHGIFMKYGRNDNYL